MRRDQELDGLLHDLNNIFQTLVDVADRLSEDARWTPLSAAILRSVERGRHVALSLQSDRDRPIPFETVLESAIAFVEDATLVHGGPRIRFAREVEPGIKLPGNWAWERVLINLFLNAMQAMPEGGEIEVEARHSGAGLRLVVRDTGSGIPPELLERVFEPHVSTKSGGGLGLHVVRTIIQHDGGSIQAANRADGRGAEFIIALPAAAHRVRAHA